MFNSLGQVIAVLVGGLVGYLLGSISPAVLVAKSQGIDILKKGSGNPGATNVKRVMGPFWGNLVFACDFLKGFIAAGWPFIAFQAQEAVTYCAIASFIGSVIGHSFSIFLKFKGGKGVATTTGGMLALMPFVLIIGALVWVIVFYSTRYVSLASLALGVSLPVSAYLLSHSPVYAGLALLLMLFILIRHRGNIIRLVEGTEKKFDKKSKARS